MSATDGLFRNTCVIDYDVVARASMKILCLCLFLAKNTPPPGNKTGGLGF